MKAAIINDTHYGCRNDNLVVDAYFRRFYEEVFFPYLDEHKIKLVFHLGDVFDRRKFINYSILKNCREYFFDPLIKRKINVHMIAGNHDEYYKNTPEVNSPELLLQEYPNITIYTAPKTIDVDNCKIAMLPWVCSGNFDASMDFLDSTPAQILFAHLEIAGFEMHRGRASDHGFPKDLFQKFDIVASGHFHHKSQENNIMYLGAPYEMTWADYNDQRGFHIFDTETREFEYVKNPLSIFKKLYYDDSKAESIDQLFETEDVTDCYIKVIIKNKTNAYWFDLYHENLMKRNPASLQVVEDSILFDDYDDSLAEVEDTLTLLQKYCEQLEVSTDKGKIKRFITQLYQEALEVE